MSYIILNNINILSYYISVYIIMIANKYNIIEEIGSGTFGSIYKGQNIRTGEDVAIKVEPLQNGTNLLKNEARIYQYLKGGIGIPQVKWFGVDDTSLNTILPNLKNFSITNLGFV